MGDSLRIDPSQYYDIYRAASSTVANQSFADRLRDDLGITDEEQGELFKAFKGWEKDRNDEPIAEYLEKAGNVELALKVLVNSPPYTGEDGLEARVRVRKFQGDDTVALLKSARIHAPQSPAGSSSVPAKADPKKMFEDAVNQALAKLEQRGMGDHSRPDQLVGYAYTQFSLALATKILGNPEKARVIMEQIKVFVEVVYDYLDEDLVKETLYSNTIPTLERGFWYNTTLTLQGEHDNLFQLVSEKKWDEVFRYLDGIQGLYEHTILLSHVVKEAATDGVFGRRLGLVTAPPLEVGKFEPYEALRENLGSIDEDKRPTVVGGFLALSGQEDWGMRALIAKTFGRDWNYIPENQRSDVSEVLERMLKDEHWLVLIAATKAVENGWTFIPEDKKPGLRSALETLKRHDVILVQVAAKKALATIGLTEKVLSYAEEANQPTPAVPSPSTADFSWMTKKHYADLHMAVKEIIHKNRYEEFGLVDDRDSDKDVRGLSFDLREASFGIPGHLDKIHQAGADEPYFFYNLLRILASSDYYERNQEVQERFATFFDVSARVSSEDKDVFLQAFGELLLGWDLFPEAEQLKLIEVLKSYLENGDDGKQYLSARAFRYGRRFIPKQLREGVAESLTKRLQGVKDEGESFFVVREVVHALVANWESVPEGKRGEVNNTLRRILKDNGDPWVREGVETGLASVPAGSSLPSIYDIYHLSPDQIPDHLSRLAEDNWKEVANAVRYLRYNWDRVPENELPNLVNTLVSLSSSGHYVVRVLAVKAFGAGWKYIQQQDKLPVVVQILEQVLNRRKYWLVLVAAAEAVEKGWAFIPEGKRDGLRSTLETLRGNIDPLTRDAADKALAAAPAGEQSAFARARSGRLGDAVLDEETLPARDDKEAAVRGGQVVADATVALAEEAAPVEKSVRRELLDVVEAQTREIMLHDARTTAALILIETNGWRITGTPTEKLVVSDDEEQRIAIYRVTEDGVLVIETKDEAREELLRIDDIEDKARKIAADWIREALDLIGEIKDRGPKILGEVEEILREGKYITLGNVLRFTEKVMDLTHSHQISLENGRKLMGAIQALQMFVDEPAATATPKGPELRKPESDGLFGQVGENPEEIRAAMRRFEEKVGGFGHQVRARRVGASLPAGKAGSPRPTKGQPLGQALARLFFAGRNDLKAELEAAELTAEQRRELARASGATLIATAEQIVSELSSKSPTHLLTHSPTHKVGPAGTTAARPAVNPALIGK